MDTELKSRQIRLSAENVAKVLICKNFCLPIFTEVWKNWKRCLIFKSVPKVLSTKRFFAEFFSGFFPSM